MNDDKHYEKLEDQFKSRRINLQDLIDSIDETEDIAHLYPALDSLKSISERYTNFIHVAEGGEKVIESTFDSLAQRKVAFASPKNKSPASQERFLREARLMAYLEHPNIMPVYDIGLKEEIPYFTMELIHGENLAEKRAKGKLTKDDLNEFLVVFQRVCDAVAFAHSKGVAHLDIKPQNIQMGPFGEVLLCDWGLAKSVSDTDDLEIPENLDVSMTADLTVRGVLRGTPGYMSPSLSKGNSGTLEDDVYALGATLYFILSGQCPHYSSDVKEMISNTVINDPQAPSKLFPDFEIPPALEAVALKALSKENGYKTVQELRKEIVNHLRGYATQAEEAGFLTLLKLLYIRHKTLSNTVLVAIIILVSVTLFFINSLQGEKEKELQAKLIAEQAKEEALASSNMYKNELRYNHYLMEGIDESLKKIINEVNRKNLPVDIQKILVKVGRGNLNGEAYEAAAQMLETLAENSQGTARDDAMHDLIFTKIFMHDFSSALNLLQKLSKEELMRADIFQFKSICKRFENKARPGGVLSIPDYRNFVLEVRKHERSRVWFFRHSFNYYLRKCNSDEDILGLYEVALDLYEPAREYRVKLSSADGYKTLSFENASGMKYLHMAQLLNALQIHTLDLRGTGLKNLIFTREMSVKKLNIAGTKIKDLRPLSLSEELETVIVKNLEDINWWKELSQQGIQVKLS
ncbi:MAG: serine/threonine protein kinase, partial [Lentisphaeraceae bacterium]|nr:serine/threonine protein kinase [Lentisphaeraceae bacterium]